MIVFEGETFGSYRALALNYDVNYSTFKGRRRKGWTLNQALGLEKYTKQRDDWRDITVGGIHYPSISAAASHYNLDANVCRDRIDLGWDISEVFEITSTDRKPYKSKVMIKGKILPSLRAGAKELGLPYTTFLYRLRNDNLVDSIKLNSLIGTTKPFIYEGQIYPSLYLMLMSCDGMEVKVAKRASITMSEFRIRNMPTCWSINELSKFTGIEKPRFLVGFELFIEAVSEWINLKNVLLDGSDYLNTRLKKAGFSRTKYIEHYAIENVFES